MSGGGENGTPEKQEGRGAFTRVYSGSLRRNGRRFWNFRTSCGRPPSWRERISSRLRPFACGKGATAGGREALRRWEMTEAVLAFSMRSGAEAMTSREESCIFSAWARAFRGGVNGTAFDYDRVSGTEQVEGLIYVIALHPDAAVGGGGADGAFLRRTVDINQARVSVPVTGFQTFQPHDARDDGVPARRIGRDAFPGGLAAFKHHALGLSAADFGSDAMGAQRSAAASLSVSQAEFGSADRVGFHHPAIAHDGHFLVPDADDRAVFHDGGGLIIRTGTGCQDSEHSEKLRRRVESGVLLAREAQAWERRQFLALAVCLAGNRLEIMRPREQNPV